ncbi:MAG: phosphoribosylamine--glycine ligase [Ignavibacteria bacterium]|nr:phosphoribosylamine--glycine ligase [Ignavibacteria bacterium]
MKERILLIGSGGREHAIARALVQSESCGELFCVPGNPGIAALCQIVQVDTSNHAELCAWCRRNGITLVVVGPEQPLAEGIADSLRSEGIATFGPSQRAARIESSKEFSKNLMRKYGIPTADYCVFAQAEIEAALRYVEAHSYPVVIKASGLAAGKGVVIAENITEAQLAIRSIFDGEFGSSGSTIVVEEYLQGIEASLFAITDGTSFTVLAPAQDHKRIGDNDQGKNTGGMGAYAPAPVVTPQGKLWIEEHIIAPVLSALRMEDSEFNGCLFVGLMIAADGTSKVIEFNCRFGDPETQAVLSVLRGDLAGLFASVAHGKIDPSYVQKIAEGFACGVVMASGGYPDTYAVGKEISGLDEVEKLPNVFAYHAGTALRNEKLVTSGGRVLGIVGTGETLPDAVKVAYQGVSLVKFENNYFRKDIASRGLTGK